MAYPPPQNQWSPPGKPEKQRKSPLVKAVLVVAIAAPIFLVVVVSGTVVYRLVDEGVQPGSPPDEGTDRSEADAADAEEGADPDAEASEEPEQPRETGQPEDDPEALTEATVDGWKGVQVEKRPLAYDVPDDWLVESPGLMMGFEQDDPDAPFGSSPVLGMSGVATYGERAADCPGHPPELGAIGTSAAGEVVDTGRNAADQAEAWARAGYGEGSQVSVGEPVPFSANGLSGHEATANIEVASQECYPSTAVVRVVSVDAPDADDVYNLVIYADTSGGEAPGTESFDQVISSLRPTN